MLIEIFSYSTPILILLLALAAIRFGMQVAKENQSKNDSQ